MAKNMQAMKKKAMAEAKAMKTQAQKHWKKAKKSFVSAEHKVQSYVKTHPKHAAAIAAGVAAAIATAVIVARRKHK